MNGSCMFWKVFEIFVVTYRLREGQGGLLGGRVRREERGER